MKMPGQSLTEYGVVMALVLVVSITGLRLFGKNISQAFEAMLPAPGVASTVTASASSSSGAIVSDPLADFSADTDDSGNLASTTTAKQNNKQNNKKKPKTKPRKTKADLILEKYRGITQTAGGLGNSQQLFANSNDLVKQAMKYKKSDPALFNQLVKLGLQGKQLAKKTTKYLQSGTDQNRDDLLYAGTMYGQKSAKVMFSSQAAKRLSTKDRGLVNDLSNANWLTVQYTVSPDSLKKGLTGRAVNPENSGSHTQEMIKRITSDNTDSQSTGKNKAAKTINRNSDTIITCGKNLKCKK